MTLALLITAVGGAWAQTQITQDFENGLGDWTKANCHSNSGVINTYTPTHSGTNMFRFYYMTTPQYLISPEIDATGGGTMSFYYARYSGSYEESFKVGYSTTTNDPTAFTWGDEETCTNIFTSEGYLEYTYDIPAGAKYVAIACTSPDRYYLFIDDIKIEYAAADPITVEPDVEVTTNAASEGATFTEASFQMPAFDATADYELVRDMSVQMTAQVGTDPEAQPRYRVKKDGSNWIPADLQPTDIPGLFSVTDGIENKTLTQSTDYYCLFYKLDEQTLEPDGDGVELTDFDFAPGLYAVKAVAITGSDYDGETALSNTFKLFQGYEVTVPAGEFATFYKEENLYADPVTSADAKIYTITAVEDDQATLTELTTAAANTPLLVQNTSADTKTFLLIPTDDAGDNVTVYTGFVGTLVDATIAASTEAQTNYAFNGKQFVFVKDDLAVAANRAWLEVPAVISNAKAITLVFGDATGLKAIDNGQLTIDNGDWYDLNGRKLNGMPTKKGVYIMNGKKVVVK